MWQKLLAVSLGVLVGYWLIDDFNPDDVKGKRVLITGASTGIGEQIAYTYARLGASVVVTARREKRLQEVVERCQLEGEGRGQYHYVTADMSDLNDTQRVIQAAVDLMGGLDVIVLNHIILKDLWHWVGSHGNLTLLEDVMRVNFLAYVHLASHALPHLEKTSGSIVVVSSLAGKLGQPFVAEYSASKFALDGFFSGLRQEMVLRDCDISITLCILGFISTENSVSQLLKYGQDFLVSIVSAASPADTALAIVKGGATRVHEVYYPYLQTKPLIMIRHWFPSFVDYVNRFPYVATS